MQPNRKGLSKSFTYVLIKRIRSDIAAARARGKHIGRRLGQLIKSDITSGGLVFACCCSPLLAAAEDVPGTISLTPEIDLQLQEVSVLVP